jgi:hypothetical protein
VGCDTLDGALLPNCTVTGTAYKKICKIRPQERSRFISDSQGVSRHALAAVCLEMSLTLCLNNDVNNQGESE